MPLDHHLVHLFDGRERPITELDDVLVSEIQLMMVRHDKDFSLSDYTRTTINLLSFFPISYHYYIPL